MGMTSDNSGTHAASVGRRRGDIQGLRAVAVLLVVIYHADLGFSGGFVGVDVFFVISGYVITTALTTELGRTDRVNLGHFHLRRTQQVVACTRCDVDSCDVGEQSALADWRPTDYGPNRSSSGAVQREHVSDPIRQRGWLL